MAPNTWRMWLVVLIAAESDGRVMLLGGGLVEGCDRGCAYLRRHIDVQWLHN